MHKLKIKNSASYNEKKIKLAKFTFKANSTACVYKSIQDSISTVSAIKAFKKN